MLRSPVTMIFCLVLALSRLASAENITDAVNQLDTFFASAETLESFQGTVLIASGSDVLYLRGFGHSDIEQQAPTVPWNRYAIGSISKTFTSAAIGILLKRGVVALDDPIRTYLTDFPHGNITVRQLLLHQSGLSNPDYASLGTARLSLEELVEHIGEKPLLFDPGTKSAYSNAGYNVLARIIETTGGVPFEEFLQREIFRPLGMKNTGQYSAENLVSHRADGYEPAPGGGLLNAQELNIHLSVGSGSLYSTVHDLLRWADAIRNRRLVNLTEWEWPYGWGKLKEPSEGVEQSGLVSGYSASLYIFNDPSITVIVLANVESDEWTAWARNAARIVFNSIEPASDPVAAGGN